MKELKVKITFTEEVLGSQCADKEIHRTYIASKAPDAPSREDEVATLGVDAVEEKSMTIFHKYEDGKPFVYDYQVKGMFKDSCGMLRKVKGSESSKIKAYKKEIDGLIFVKERKIPLIFDGDMGTCQRPLRAIHHREKEYPLHVQRLFRLEQRWNLPFSAWKTVM